VAEHIARERNLSLEDVARQTLHNATILFNL
jgi:Tat protein secretion system quality control protein TatD with DNase activity